jgi:hypothetical protein
LAADVVGYSHLVEQDEAGTLSALKALRREVFDPLLAAHHGRIVKLMGDGAIAEFGSVVDAVACAVGVQKSVAERQAEVPAERRIVFRGGGMILFTDRGLEWMYRRGIWKRSDRIFDEKDAGWFDRYVSGSAFFFTGLIMVIGTILVLMRY